MFMYDYAIAADRAKAKAAHAEAMSIPSQASALARRVQAEGLTAQTFTDPNLSDAGLAERRAALVQEARERGASDLRTLRTLFSIHAETVAKDRPTLTGDPATVQLKWQQVQMRLDAGMTLREVVRNADKETLAAIRDFTPAYLQAQAAQGLPAGLQGALQETANVDEAINRLNNTIDSRLMEVDPSTRDALNAYRETRAAAAEFEVTAAHVDALNRGLHSDPMAAAMAAQFASQRATAGLD